MNEDFCVMLINQYIKFYKTNVEDVNILDDIDEEELLNEPLDFIYHEMNDYELNRDDFKNINGSHEQILKYKIFQNKELCCSSMSLISVLIEITYLHEENKEDLFYILSNE